MLVHAAGESSPGNLPNSTFAVVLAVSDEAALHKAAAFLKSKGVTFVEVTEPDPPWNGQLMALGFQPKPKEELYRYLSTFPLLRE
jgi:hypothetical protein